MAPFAALLAAGFVAMKVLERDKRRTVFVVLLALQLAALLRLKRYAFVPPAFSLPWAYVTVGMSYVFFRVLHLLDRRLPGRARRARRRGPRT